MNLSERITMNPYVDDAWHVGPIDYPDEDDPDGSEYLLSILDGRPSTY